jgi:hypothetical protein
MEIPMASLRLRHVIPILLAALTLSWLAVPAGACPFCSEERGPTLVGDFNQAALVLLGTFTNPRLDANNGGADGGTTDFIIEEVFKKHEIVANKKKITLPRYMPQAKNKFIIFCDVYKGMIDPYRGVEIPAGSELVKYLQGAAAIKDRPLPERLRYAFDYLNSSEIDVALDAYREYARAAYSDYKDMAKALPADTLAKWLRDPKTPPYRYGLYASLLGLCGNAKDAKLLREMIQDPQKRQGSGLDGMLAGYITIEPKEGWAYLQTLLKDGKQEFLMRYAALRTIRFLWDQRPDLIGKMDLVQGIAVVLDQHDMADFAIEDLRKWQRWEMTDRVLDLFTRETHNVPVVKRAILRFALRSPQARARAFVEEQRRRDSEWVSDTEELLRLEATPPAETSPAPQK